MGPDLALTVVCCETPISDVLSMRLALPLHPLASCAPRNCSLTAWCAATSFSDINRRNSLERIRARRSRACMRSNDCHPLGAHCPARPEDLADLDHFGHP